MLWVVFDGRPGLFLGDVFIAEHPQAFKGLVGLTKFTLPQVLINALQQSLAIFLQRFRDAALIECWTCTRRLHGGCAMP